MCIRSYTETLGPIFLALNIISEILPPLIRVALNIKLDNTVYVKVPGMQQIVVLISLKKKKRFNV